MKHTIPNRNSSMRAYVQKGNEGDLNYLNLEQIAYWFGERGYEVVRFDFRQLTDGQLDRALNRDRDETVFAGGVETIREALQQADRPLPEHFEIPDCLAPWIGREVKTTTLGEVRRMVDRHDVSLPVHVKPVSHHKNFTGRTFTAVRDLAPSAAIEDDLPVLVQKTVHFKSEWHAAIFRGRIMNVAHSKGDPLLFPEPNVLRDALETYQGAPVAYEMVWGITDSGKTLLVEINDGLALNNNGVRGQVYTAMIEARWRQLMGLPDNGIGSRL